MNWFYQLTGFLEQSPEQVRSLIHCDNGILHSTVNQKRYCYGALEVASVKQLREKVEQLALPKGHIHATQKVANVQALHVDKANAGALFQVASQFNLLEMISYHITPEMGVALYQKDLTQGPACAVACGAGTIYRNYFVPLENQFGQTANKQIDTLAEIGEALGNQQGALWRMQNGYLLTDAKALTHINRQLAALTVSERQALVEKLAIGVQWHTQVTLNECEHTVTQAYCSALPVSYNALDCDVFYPFAQLVLDAAYQATFYAAVLNAHATGNNKLYLTLLGGGAFGNELSWIISSIEKTLRQFRHYNLDVNIVSYRSSNALVDNMLQGLSDAGDINGNI